MSATPPVPAADTVLGLENPLLAYLGVRLTDAGPGRCEFQLDIEPRHLNRSGSLHGGVIATMLDAACGYSGLHTAADAAPANAVTVMLAISYVGRADEGRIRAVGRVTAAGRKIYFAAAELLAGDGRLLATAQGSFKRSAASTDRASGDGGPPAR
jgi:uncharacterized protein (TIGR00369 family)